jgi:hypothetical protein
MFGRRTYDATAPKKTLAPEPAATAAPRGAVSRAPAAPSQVSMDVLDNIKSQLENLKPDEHAKLRAWFLERDQLLWDQQIARDQKAGKLDALIAEANADRDAGRERDL